MSKYENEYRYIQFPISLMQGLFEDKKTALNNILCYGVYKFSKEFEFNLDDVVRQIIYMYYKNTLGEKIMDMIDAIEWDEFGDDESEGFEDGEYAPNPEEISELLDEFENNSEFKKLSIEYYQVHMATKSLKLSGGIEAVITIGKEIEDIILPLEPTSMIKIEMLLSIRDHDHQEFYLMQFAGYIAVGSILGKKPYVKTNKNHILSRVFGYSSMKEVPQEIMDSDLFKKYLLRYHMDKLIRHLELDWNVKTYSNNMRGIYVSIGDKISYDHLGEVSEKRKLKNRYEELREIKRKVKFTAA